jgi:hypothetical protein
MCQGPGVGAGRRPRAAAQHGGDARHQRLLDLLRADEVDMRVETACGDDLAFARDHLGAGADDDVDTGLDVGIACLADRGDAPASEPDIGLHDSPMVEDEGVGDHRVDRAFGARRLRLAHAVADHLAAAELHLLAIGGEILLDLDDELRVGEADAVAGRGTEHLGVMRAREGGRGQRITGWGHREDSRHRGKGGRIEGGAIECCGGGASEFGVDCGQEVVRKIGAARAVSGERALHGAPIRNVEIVRG